MRELFTHDLCACPDSVQDPVRAGGDQARHPDRAAEARPGTGGDRTRRAVRGVEDARTRGAQDARGHRSRGHEPVQGCHRTAGRRDHGPGGVRRAPAPRTGGAAPLHHPQGLAGGGPGSSGARRLGDRQGGQVAGQPGLPPGAVPALRQPAARPDARRDPRPGRPRVDRRLVGDPVLGARGGRAPRDPAARPRRRRHGRRRGPARPHRIVRAPCLPRRRRRGGAA